MFILNCGHRAHVRLSDIRLPDCFSSCQPAVENCHQPRKYGIRAGNSGIMKRPLNPFLDLHMAESLMDNMAPNIFVEMH